jgi:IPT/TIG domain
MGYYLKVLCRRKLSTWLILALFSALLAPIFSQSASASGATPLFTLQGSDLNAFGGEYWYTTAGAPESVTVNSGRGGLTKTLTPAAGALFGGKSSGDSLTGTIGNTTSLDTVTVELWLKLSDSGTVENATGSMLFSWNPGSGMNNYNIYHFQSKIGFNTFNSDLYGFDSTLLEDNQWNHFVFIMTDTGGESDQKIFVNGTNRTLSCLIGTCTSSRTFSPGGNFLFMDNAKAVGTWNAKGTIGQVKIYNQGITASNALSNFESTRNSYITGLGNLNDVTITRTANLTDSATVLNSSLSSADSMTITGFDTQTVRVTATTDTATVNITTTTGLTKATGSGYANSGSNAITTAGTTVAFEGNVADVQAALATLRLNLPTQRSGSFSGLATITISVSYVGGSSTAFNSDNDHFYRLYSPNLTWQNAKNATTASGNCGISFNGLCGYLATVTSETETVFISRKVTDEPSWIGGDDTSVEGTWRWPSNSPEGAAIFFKDSANNPGTLNVNYCSDGLKGICPSAVTGNIDRYNNWNSGEPNQSGEEDALQIVNGSAGEWNDLPVASTQLPYIIEFGGKTGEALTYQPRTRNVLVNFTFTPVSLSVVSIPTCTPASITSISPAGGSSAGGTRVTLSGQGLNSSIYLNGRAVQISQSSSTSAVFASPPGVKGVATVTIQGCGNSASSTFIYDPDPVITSLSSTSVSTAGGILTILGSFLSGATLSVDGVNGVIESNSDLTIKAKLPSASVGEKVIKISTPFGSTSSRLSYIDPPVLKPIAAGVYIAQGDEVKLSFATVGATSYSAAGVLPSGLQINSSTGNLFGVAQREGIFNFSITASNLVGSDTKMYSLSIDRATPKAISANIYFGHKNSSLSLSNKATLDRLVLRIMKVAPRNLLPTLTIGVTPKSNEGTLSINRQNLIKSYLESQGIKFRSVILTSGSPNRISTSISWQR